MTVLQCARPGANVVETVIESMKEVAQRIVYLAGSAGSNVDSYIKVYYDDKFRSLSNGELQTLVEVIEESIAKILGGVLLVVELLMSLCMLILLEIKKMKAISI